MIALAAIRLGAARDWAEALLTPVTVVVLLAEAARKGQEEAQRRVGGQTKHADSGGGYRPDGTRIVQVNSIFELARLVKK